MAVVSTTGDCTEGSEATGAWEVGNPGSCTPDAPGNPSTAAPPGTPETPSVTDPGNAAGNPESWETACPGRWDPCSKESVLPEMLALVVLGLPGRLKPRLLAAPGS
mmetsp:Transcript_11432/g.18008  ORF Transcript_11432/g.18008 Transcript_11432/m.18008 type:complete len:106 (-) Transcript_11432:332-649(-)